MSVKLIKIAKQYIKAGFFVIPTTEHKEPAIGNWRQFQEGPMTDEEVEQYFANANSIAVLCGGTPRVFCLDADMKYDLSTDLWERFKKAVPNKILKKMMVQKTRNKGFHLVARVPASRLVGNQKFASRYTTADEKHQTYIDAFSDIETKDKALKIALSDNTRVLFESRSGTPEKCGGYFLISPSAGYEIIFGKIGEITEEEYDTLIEAARSFNEIKIVEKVSAKNINNDNWSKTPFDHFNEDGDAVGTLVNYGWKILSDHGNIIKLKRPGKSHSTHSAIYNKDTGIFVFFSTSTSFDVGKGYSKVGVFIHLECDNDSTLAFKKLVENGFGIKK